MCTFMWNWAQFLEKSYPFINFPPLRGGGGEGGREGGEEGIDYRREFKEKKFLKC